MDKKTDQLIVDFVVDGNDFEDWLPQYSIAPTDVIPIVRERLDSESGEVRRSIDAAVWDFRPSFIKNVKRPQFNARLETVATNGLWKGAFSSSRCIVPMRGYFEWSERVDPNGKSVKQPHFIHGNTPLLAAAAIYTTRRVNGEWIMSTAIITREARDASGEVHDRMPAFLNSDMYDPWLSPRKLESDAERQHMAMLLHTISEQVASTITTYEVDRVVNNSRTVDRFDARLIEAIKA